MSTVTHEAIILESPYLFSGQSPRYKFKTIVSALGTMLRLGYSGSLAGRYSLYLDILASGRTPANPEDVMFMRLPAEFFQCEDAIGREFLGPVGEATLLASRCDGVVWLECRVSDEDEMTYRFRMSESVYGDLIAAGRDALEEMAQGEGGA